MRNTGGRLRLAEPDDGCDRQQVGGQLDLLQKIKDATGYDRLETIGPWSNRTSTETAEVGEVWEGNCCLEDRVSSSLSGTAGPGRYILVRGFGRSRRPVPTNAGRPN